MTKRIRTIRARQHAEAGEFKELRDLRNPETRAAITANRAYSALYGE